MPIWESLIPRDPEPNGTKVTLIHQRSGEDTPMQPELFRFSNDVYVWNYWTNKQMEPQEKYIVRAMAPDGRQSYATVTTPSFLPIPVIFLQRLKHVFTSGSTHIQQGKKNYPNIDIDPPA
jgi:hypothetical protein